MAKTYIKLDGNLIPISLDTVGTISKEEQTKTVTEPNFSSGNVVVTPDAGKVLTQVTVVKDNDLVPENIVKDVNIFGVVGTAETGGSVGGTVDIIESDEGGNVSIEFVDDSGYHSGDYSSETLSSVYWIKLNGTSYVGYDGSLSITGATENELLSGKVVTGPISIDIYSMIICLTGDTLITMSDNTTKRIDEMEVGDCFLRYNFETQSLEEDTVSYTDSKMNKTASEYDVWTFDDGTIIKTVHRHEFYNVELESVEYMDKWEIGQHTYKIDGTTPKLIKHETIKETVKHYSLKGKKTYTSCFANNLLTGNRHCRGKKIILEAKNYE